MILTKSAILLKRLLLIHKVIGMKDILHPPVVAACSREHAAHQMIAAVSMVKGMKRVVRIHSELITCNKKCAACSKREVALSGSDCTCAYSCSRIISCPGCNYAIFRKAKLTCHISFQSACLFTALIKPRKPLLSYIAYVKHLL